MDNTNPSPGAKARAVRALAQSLDNDGAMTYEDMVGIVVHALTNASPEATVAAHELREWNNEDRDLPKFTVNPEQSTGYAEIAQLVIDVADEYRARHVVAPVPPPPLPFPFGQSAAPWSLPVYSVAPPPVLPGSAVDTVLSNVANVLTSLRSDLRRMAEREGHTIRRMDAAMLENRAKLCNDTIKAMNALRGNQCMRDECPETAMQGQNLCAMHTANDMFGTDPDQ